jgi:[acyl-carrier-protein] S-malonyltransferase
MPTEGDSLALVFPGQGAQQPGMLAPFVDAPGFERHAGIVSDLLGWDVRQLDRQPPEALSANLTSSLLTVLCSVLALGRLETAPIAVAGYSVGQWSALHAAGVLDAETMFGLVARRAKLMDEALAAAPPSGMLAVIGVARPLVDGVCDAARREGLLLQLCNDNAPGQFTLGGSLLGLACAEQSLAAHKPRVLKRLPVAGAWHSTLMAPVAAPLQAVIEKFTLAPPRCPVVDNVSGDWWTAGDNAALAQQVARPVLWQQGVRRLVGAGATRCLETGWGDVLTRFGFFIDRSVRHEALAPLPRERA